MFSAGQDKATTTAPVTKDKPRGTLTRGIFGGALPLFQGGPSLLCPKSWLPGFPKAKRDPRRTCTTLLKGGEKDITTKEDLFGCR